MFEEPEEFSSAAKNTEQPKRARRGKRRKTKLGIVVAICVLVIGLGVSGWWFFVHKSAGALPKQTLSKISGFQPYFLKPSFSTDFTLQPKSVRYQDGVLLFSMHDTIGKTLAFTEEATPSGFDTSAINSDKQFNNEFGQGLITDQSNRTTGALFTSDNTWILINAPQPIGTTLMQQILNALIPVKR